MSDNLADVIEKVQKLLNLADRSDKPGEVTAAQRLAQKLITKYQIEEAHLNNHVGSGGITSKQVDNPSPYSIYKSMLLHSIAKNNFCKVLRGDGYCMIYGYASDIKICIALYDMLFVHMISEQKYKLAQIKDQSFETIDSKAWTRAFFAGYAISIDDRMKESKSETIEEASKSDTSVAVVLRDKQHAVEEFFQSIPRKSPTSVMLSSSDGYREGQQSGNEAQLNQEGIGSE